MIENVYLDTIVSKINYINIEMEKKIVIVYILAKKIPTYFFYKPYRTTFYQLQKIIPR